MAMGCSDGAAVADRPGSKRNNHRQALQRIHLRQQTIVALIEGRLSLLEAADRFRDPIPGTQSDDGESVCRSVIGWAHLALRDRPERAEALSEVLENQLSAHLARHGAVRLPRS